MDIQTLKNIIGNTNLSDEDIKQFKNYLIRYAGIIHCCNNLAYIRIEDISNLFNDDQSDIQNEIKNHIDSFDRMLANVDSSGLLENTDTYHFDNNLALCQAGLEFLANLKGWNNKYSRVIIDLIMAMQLSVYNAHKSNGLYWYSNVVFDTKQIYQELNSQIVDVVCSLAEIRINGTTLKIDSSFKRPAVELNNRIGDILLGDLFRYVHFGENKPNINGKVQIWENDVSVDDLHTNHWIDFSIPASSYSLTFSKLSYEFSIEDLSKIIWWQDIH